MDNLITHISRGVGQKRKKKPSAVLIRLGSKRAADKLLPDYDDSSDEDYIPDDFVPIKKKVTFAKEPKVTRTKRARRAAAAAATTNGGDCERNKSLSDRAWSDLIPTEILTHIFDLVLINCDNKLKTRIRLSKVCRLWWTVTFDPLLWRDVDLSYGWVKEPLQILRKLSEQGRLEQLQSLDLSNSAKTNNSMIEYISREFPHLRHLNLSNCKNVRGPELQLIKEKLTDLTSLDISTSSRRAYTHIAQELNSLLYSQRCKLHSCKLAGWKEPYKGLIQTVIPTLTSLTILDISDFEVRLISDLIEMMIPLSPNLQILRMSRVSVTSSSDISPKVEDRMESLQFSQLIELTIPEMHVLNPQYLQYILRGADKLRHLDVRGWKFSLLGYLGEAPLTQLHSLNMRNVIMDRPATEVPRLIDISENLVDIDVSWLKLCGEDTFSKLIDGLSRVGSKLEALHCAGTLISKLQLRSVLTYCQELRVLDVESCRGLERGVKRSYNDRQELKSLKDMIRIKSSS